MRKILTILLLFICSILFGQDIKPISPNFKPLQSPSFSYYTTDSSVWIYKGAVYGWTKLARFKDLQDTLKYYVPYTGAINNVNLGFHTITTDGINLNTDYAPTGSEPVGSLRWNAQDDTYDLKTVHNTYQLGQELAPLFKNVSGGMMYNGQVAYYAGAVGSSANIQMTSAALDGTFLPSRIVGILTEDIPNNGWGKVTWFGEIRNFDISHVKQSTDGIWSKDDILYASNIESGRMTNIKPQAPNYIAEMCVILSISGNNVTVFTRPTWNTKLEDLANVNGTPLLASGQIPVWNNAYKYFDFTENINDYKPINYCATTMAVNYGTLNQGTVADLCAVGGTDVIIQEIVSNPPYQVTFTFNGVQRLSGFKFYGRYNGSSSHNVHVEAYNYNTETWDYLGEFSHANSKRWYSFAINLPNNYISSNVTQVRIVHQDTGIVTHQLILDYVNVNYGGGGGSGFITAGSVDFTPSGNIASTNVQGAIQELDAEKEPVFYKGDLSSGSTALTISNGTGRLVGSATSTVSVTSGYTIPSTTSVTAYDSHLTNDGDLSATNEGSLSVVGTSNNAAISSNTSGSNTLNIKGGGINTVSVSSNDITITGTEVDGSISNEGSLTVAAGTSTTSIINSNTSGQTGVTLSVDGTNLGISENSNTITLSNLKPDQTVSLSNGTGISTSGTYPSFTITNTAPNVTTDLSVSGTSSPLTLNSSDGTDVTITAGTGISLAGTSSNITVTNSSPDTYAAVTKGNLTESVTGLQFDATRQVIGGAATLSLTSGYVIPTTTEESNWNTAFTHSQNDADISATNEIQAPTLNGQSLGLTQTSTTVTLTNSSVGLGNVTNNAQVTRTEMGAANGVATLDSGGKVPFTQLPSSLMIYKGTWSALTNTPTLTNGIGTAGWVYKNNLAGTVNFGSGNISFYVGDWVIYNGTTWERSVGTDNVVSVNGQQGIVVLNTSHIPENTNLYYTDARSRASISENITGIDYNNTTGVFSQTSGYGIPTTTQINQIHPQGTDIQEPTLVGDNIGLTQTTTTISISGKEDKSNKENTTVDNSTTKYPTVNLLKTYADTKDPSSTNELNTSVSFDSPSRVLSIVDAGGTKTTTIPNDNITNCYMNTFAVTSTDISVTWPTNFADNTYELSVKHWYLETINGKSVRVYSGVYDFAQTVSGFSCKLDTLAGYITYFAVNSTNLYPITISNYVPLTSIVTTVGSPGSDSSIPSEKAVRTAINGFSSMVYPSAGIALSTGSAWATSITDNSINWDNAYTDRLKWDGGSTGLVAATGRASLGSTTIGSNLFTLTNPSAITFPRFNADNTISTLSATDFKTAIGGGITNNSQIIKFDTGTTENTDLYTFDGSSSKTIDIKAGQNVTLTKTANSIVINSTASGGGGLTYNFQLNESINQGQVVQLLNSGSIEKITGSQIAESIPASSEYTAISTSGLYTKIAFDPNNANKFILIFADTNAGRYGTAMVGTVSGTTISFGSKYVFYAGSCYGFAMDFDKVSSNKFSIFFKDGNAASYVIVGTYSSSTITFGPSSYFNNYVYSASNVADIDIDYIPNTANKFIVTYKDPNKYGYSKVGTISGTTVSFSTPYNFSTYIEKFAATIDSKNPSSFIVAYYGNYGYARPGILNGTTITFGTEITFATSSGTGVDCLFDPYFANKFAIVSSTDSNPYPPRVIIGTTTGSLITLNSSYTIGSNYVLNYSATFDPNNYEKLIVCGSSPSGNMGYIIICTVSGTSVSVNSTYNFNLSSSSQYINVSSDSNSIGKFALCYTDETSSNKPTVILGQVSSVVTNLSSSRLLGILQESGTSGQTKSVSLLGGVDSHQSSLTPNSLYYVQWDGTISTTSSAPAIYLGKAINSTTIQMKPTQSP